MKLFSILIIVIIYSSGVFALDNKIIVKIENEVITKVDIINEETYLKALNPNIKNLDPIKLQEISKNSLIREKIKEKEILKYVENIDLKKNYLNQLIKQRYSRLKLGNEVEFINYLKNFNIDIKTIEKKISIEALWNQLIYQKFKNKIKIDQKKLEEQISKKIREKEKNLLLSEIVFKIRQKKDLNKKYSEILNNINEDGFESAALIHSISNSSKIGGKLGWIKQSSLNKSINSELSDLKTGDITKPIFTPNGYLILKIDNIKIIKQKIDKNTELNELIRLKTTQQLEQQSIIYFNKIKKNTNINEL